MAVLKIGSKGDEVVKLQQYLNLTADGIFGKATETAVKKFQMNNGLTVDGIVGQKTLALLEKTQLNNKRIADYVIYNPLNIHITKSANRPIKYLAIHFTAGSNSKEGRATSTKKVFETNKASADFCVDDVQIVQFNPDIKNYYCWAVGDKKYNNKGGQLYGKALNKNTVSIEICSTCKPSTQEAVNVANHIGWSFTDAALNNALKLTKTIMKKYNIPLENVIRHYDVSGKLCPGVIGWNNEKIYDLSTKKYTSYSDSKKWEEFKSKLK